MSQAVVLGGGLILIIIVVVLVAGAYIMSRNSQITPTPSTRPSSTPSSGGGGGGQSCLRDSDCIGKSGGPKCVNRVCKPTPPAGKCYFSEDCTATNTSHCYFPPGEKPADGLGSCSYCASSSQCPRSQVCYLGDCIDPNQMPDIECGSNSDCNFHPQNKLQCYISPGAQRGICSECTRSSHCSVFGDPKKSMCQAESIDQPVCVECITDSDCDFTSGVCRFDGTCAPECNTISDCPLEYRNSADPAFNGRCFENVCQRCRKTRSNPPTCGYVY